MAGRKSKQEEHSLSAEITVLQEISSRNKLRYRS